MPKTYNILVTLNETYLPYLNVMLSTMLAANPGKYFRVWLLHRGIRPEALENTESLLWERGGLFPVEADDSLFEGAPTTSRYPIEIYYRIFAAHLLPDTLDRVLYLDPDLVVNGSIDELYNLDMGQKLYAAASHIGGFMHRLNEYRLGMDESELYINSGVMLMNLSELREVLDEGAVYRFIEEHRRSLMLPDQDIISGLYGSQIIPLDPLRYNMTERLYAQQLLRGEHIDVEWVRENSVIIHYCGRNKPWKPNYIGKLGVFWSKAEKLI